MFRIFKYSFFDLLRSKWSLIYFLFYFILTTLLLYMSGNGSKVILTLMNITLVLNPLVSAVFGIMYLYNSREFFELLLAQPIKRKEIFLGQYLGLATSLGASFFLGVGIPFVFMGVWFTDQLVNLVMLLFVGTVLTYVFTAFSFWIGLRNEQRIKGFGYSILFWLFMVLIYDAILLMVIITFREYPLETFAISSVLFNPIDLSRILILLKMDISALLGYTGATFKAFFGNNTGLILSTISILVWLVIPIAGFLRTALRKDF